MIGQVLSAVECVLNIIGELSRNRIHINFTTIHLIGNSQVNGGEIDGR